MRATGMEEDDELYVSSISLSLMMSFKNLIVCHKIVSWFADVCFYYSLYLVAHIFEHRLLDREHYLDWLLSSLENAKLNSLPMWLFMIKIYWAQLTAYRKYASRLAESLLSHLLNKDLLYFIEAQSVDKRHLADGKPGAGLGLIFKQLCESVATLLTSSKESLLLPKTWNDYSQLLASLPRAMQRPDLTPIIQELERRNESINTGTRSRSTRNTPRKDIIRLLEEQSCQLACEELADKCLACTAQTPQLAIDTVLQWATSIYREGEHRIYLAVRILRIWHRQGHDTDAAIMNFILHGADRCCCKRRDVYRLVGNLARSKDFSVDRYLRWIVSHGYGHATEDDKLSCHVELLSQLCLQGLPEHVLNLRRTQLARVGVHARQEMDELQTAKSHVLHQLGGLGGYLASLSSASAAQYDNVNIEDMSMTTKFAASLWLRSHIAKIMSDKEDDAFPLRAHSESDTSITPDKFYTIVDIFEKLGDFPVLADVLGIFISSDSGSDNNIDSINTILKGISNAIQKHAEIFHAIGAFRKLSRSLLARFRNTLHLDKQRPSQPPRPPPAQSEKCLVSSLVELERLRFLRDPHVTAELTGLLSRCDQRRLLMTAVCSPASDNLGDVPSEFEDEIDKILCSGNSMDEQLQRRLFGRIMDAFERQVGAGLKKPALGTFSRWLPMLKSFGETAAAAAEKTVETVGTVGLFERMMHGRLVGVLRAEKFDVVEQEVAVRFLVGVGVLSVRGLVEAALASAGLDRGSIGENGVGDANTSITGGIEARAAAETILRCLNILFGEGQEARVLNAQVCGFSFVHLTILC